MSCFPPGHNRYQRGVGERDADHRYLGVLAFLLALPAAILLAITIIGIPPLILVEILGLAVAWILGYIGLTMLLGERILAAAKARHENTIVKIMVGWRCWG